VAIQKTKTILGQVHHVADPVRL